jgi:predicted site-specific integrase-resolvase
MLNDKQKEELVNHIHRLCERCLPLTPKIITNIAQELMWEKAFK